MVPFKNNLDLDKKHTHTHTQKPKEMSKIKKEMNLREKMLLVLDAFKILQEKEPLL